MSIFVKCTNRACNQIVPFADTQAGQTGNCPHCRTQLAIVRKSDFPWIWVIGGAAVALMLLCGGGLMILFAGIYYVRTKAEAEFVQVGGDPLLVAPLEPERIEPIVVNKGPEANDVENRIAVLFSSETQRFGISLLRLRDPRFPERPKLLTRSERGSTNNTRVKVEGFEYVWGRESPAAGAHWARNKEKLMKEVRSSDGRKWTSIMDYENDSVRVTQTVEILVGEQTKLYDTALVKYIIWNRDNKRHTVGLRIMLDTFIGSDDGMPFYVPPTAEGPARFVGAKEEFAGGKVPQFLRVLESSDLYDRSGAVAELGLRLRGFEPPEKVVVCRWPQEFGAGEALWDWPLQPMNQPAGLPKDSCVGIYWSRVNMNPKEKRTVGFTYGLGRIVGESGVAGAGASGGRIRLFTGPAQAGRPFTVTTYIKKAEGQSVTLQLPAGVRLHGDAPASQRIRTEPGMAYAQVSWQLAADKAGEYQLNAKLDDGAAAGEMAIVRERSIFDVP